MMNSAWSEVSSMMKVISSDGWMMNSDSSDLMMRGTSSDS